MEKRIVLNFLSVFYPINFKYLLSTPFIYLPAIAFFIFEIGVEIVHQVCFRLWGIPLVNRNEYFVYDRQLLACLNWLQKINCYYCSYVNNLIRYSLEISARVERYWCPLKYEKKFDNYHSQYEKFIDKNDQMSLRRKWDDLRDFSDLKK